VAGYIGAIGRQAKVLPLVLVCDALTYSSFLSQFPPVHEFQNGKGLALRMLLWNTGGARGGPDDPAGVLVRR
jgi:hypothetical protein